MTSPNPDTRSSTLWIGLLVVVVLLGIVAVVVAKSGSDDKAKKEEGSASALVSAQKGGCDAVPAADISTDTSLSPFDSATDDPALCQTIPTIKGKDLDGKPLTIGKADGKAKLILFVAHWCPHCQREVPLITAHLKTDPMPSDVELLSVSTNVQPQADNYPPKTWLDTVGWPAPVLADTAKNDFATKYGLTSFPYFLVVDAKGRVVYRNAGELDMGSFDLLVKAAQTGKPPSLEGS